MGSQPIEYNEATTSRAKVETMETKILKHEEEYNTCMSNILVWERQIE